MGDTEKGARGLSREPTSPDDPDRSYPPDEATLRAFYQSPEWKRLAYETKKERGTKCQCCGANSYDVRIVSDHIRPVRFYWHLRLERSNIQVLCDDCNHGKASWDYSDFRKSSRSPQERARAEEQFFRKAFGGYVPPDRRRKSILKQSVIDAYSNGEISQERAIGFIREHKLKSD